VVMSFSIMRRMSWTRESRQSASAESLILGDELGVKQWVVPRSSVNLGRKLGQGAFGTVFACTILDEKEEKTTEAVAKSVNPRKLSAQDVPLLKSELQIWSSVTHPACVRFLGVCLAASEYLLLAEHMAGGTLEERLHLYLGERGPLSQNELLDMMMPVADGMRYLHSKGVIHRDLKSANILVDGERLAISDFGLSRMYESQKQEFTAETGSYRWMAPEVTRHEAYDEKCDVYSYACLAYEMVSYRKPFHSMTVLEAAFAVAKDGIRPELPASCPAAIASLIRKCWQQKSEERPAFTEVYRRLEHIKMPAPAKADAPQSPSAERAPSAEPAPSAEADAGSPRNGEAKRKSDVSEKADDQSGSSVGGLKRPKSISSALVDLQVNL